MSALPAKEFSPEDRWLADFRQNPEEALACLLTGRVFLGRLQRNDPDEILFRLFQRADPEELIVLDEAMRRWMEHYLPAPPAEVSTSRWAAILQHAFSSVVRLPLHLTQGYLHSHYDQARLWLRILYQGPARDPESYLLRTLALSQRNRDLLPLWIRLCRLEEDTPLSYSAIALLGLRKLPDEQGQRSKDLDPMVFRAVVNLAEAIAVKYQGSKEGREFWFMEARNIMASYPRPEKKYWTEKFLELLQSDPHSAAAQWLGELIPRLKKELDNPKKGKVSGRYKVQPPIHEFHVLLDRVKRQPLEANHEQLAALIKRYEYYAYQTGDFDLPAKSLGAISHAIYKMDPHWALDLIAKAFAWAPYDPFKWTQWAQIEAYCGNHQKATQLLWEARGRFPENAHIRGILVQSLQAGNQLDLAVFTARQAIQDFPSITTQRTILAGVFVKQGKLEEAENVYRQSIKDLSETPVFRGGLADVLIDQNKLDQAERIIHQLKQDFPGDPIYRTRLAEVLRNQEKFYEAEQTYRKAAQDFPDNPIFRGGLAEALKDQGKWEDAEEEYRKAILAFPDDEVLARGLDFLLRDREKSRSTEVIVSTYHEIEMERFVPPSEKAPYLKAADLERGEEIPWSLLNTYRWAADQAEEAVKIRYQAKFQETCEAALTAIPNNIPILLEKGFWLLDRDPPEAEAFFRQQVANGRRLHVLGLQLGYLQAQQLQGKPVSPGDWSQLTEAFPHRKTMILLNRALLELHGQNGSRLRILESLRKRVQNGLPRLPEVLQKNEAWLQENVRNRLFAQLDHTQPFEEDNIPVIQQNSKEVGPALKSIMEQCLIAHY